MSAFTEARAQAYLEEEHTRLTYGRDPHMPIIAAIAIFRDGYAEAIRKYFGGHGDIQDKVEMKNFCAALDRAQTDAMALLETELPADQLQKMQRQFSAIRKAIREEVETSIGIRRPKVLDRKGNPTAHGVRAMNDIFRRLGAPQLAEVGDQFFTAEQQRLCLWLLQYLDEVAAADFFRAVYGKRFGLEHEHIANLRQYIGQIQVTNGNPLVEVPIELLQLPNLRDLFFNKMRDMLCEKHYFPAPKEQGINPVLEYLLDRCGEAEQTSRSEKKGNDREQFIDELTDYFMDMEEKTKTPAHLRDCIDENGEFPAKHQRVVMYEMYRQKRILNADPTGAGKTGAFIAGVEILRDLGKPCRALIICPPGEIMGEWEKRLSCEEGGYFKSDLPEGKRPKVVVIPTGDMETKRRAWEEAKTADYVIVSNARLRVGKKTRERYPDYDPVELAKQIGANCLCIDEAHNFRNPKGKDTENVFQISQCETLREGHVVVNTATPVYNTMDDIAAQLRLLHTGSNGMKPEDAGLPPHIDFANLPQLAACIKRNRAGAVRNMLLLRMLRRKLSHCLPVGTKLEAEPPVTAELSPWERVYYEAVLQYPFMDGGEKIQALSRACLHPPLYGDGGESHIGETKYRQIYDQLTRYLQESKSGKVVAFHTGLAEGITRFNGTNDPAAGNEHRYLAGRLRRDFAALGVGVYIIDGTNTDNKPLTNADGELIRDIDNAFMNRTRQILGDCRDDPRKGILFLLSEVAGEGIALTFCDRVLWTSPSTVKPKEVQGDGRVHRKGQKNDVKRTTAYIRDTIEQGKWEFALRKMVIVEKLLEGEPLTREEIDTLMDDVKRVQREGFLSYETMSPRQKVQFIFNRIFSAGKERVREFFAFDGGRYAKDLARLYHEEEELSFQGNNRRLLIALLQKNLPSLQQAFGKKLEIADIASGTMGLARALQSEKNLAVHSSDICGEMLEVGKESFEGKPIRGTVKQCAMDELDYKDGSMHVAFLSLALQYTKHKMNSGGDECIRALDKFNRILKKGGRGYIALPKQIFDTEEGEPDTARLERFYEVLENYGGFRVIRGESGRARAAEDAEDKFATYVVSLEKIGPSRMLHLPRPPRDRRFEANEWNALNFQKRKVKNGNGQRKKKERKLPTAPPPGAFHEKFILGEEELTYTSSPEEEPAKQEHRKNREKYRNVVRHISTLIVEHGTIDAIPVEKLLSVSLEEIDVQGQERRNEQCRELLERYGNCVEQIPIKELARISPVILVRGKAKKGSFLCLANIEDAKKHPTGGHGKRYFETEEFMK